MKFRFTLIFSCISLVAFAQTGIIKGQLQDADGAAVIFANVALYHAADSSMAKVETTDEGGVFRIQGLSYGKYFLEASYVGVSNLKKENLEIKDDRALDLGVLSFSPAAVKLEEATVVAQRALVEIKPDRMVFNVQGTINSTGDDGLSLLRKAPGVLIDNNNNINVLGRAGVRIFIDGKPLPLSGEDLSSFLESLQADQIDRMDIITNPGAKYEAEGNAGIIDIRLKKDKNHGTNGTFNIGASKGRFWRGNTGLSANHRNKKVNVFGTVAYGNGKSFNDMNFTSVLNGIFQEEENLTNRDFSDFNLRGGIDYFLTKKQTIGVLVNHNSSEKGSRGFNEIILSRNAAREVIDSILVAQSINDNQSTRTSYNVNYRWDDRQTGQLLNLDLDYGAYRGTSERFQPNLYFDESRENILSEVINSFDTPSDIDIYTFKLDYEKNLTGGKLGLGTKYSRVVSDNTFLFFDNFGNEVIQNDTFSNNFIYNENVYAGYVTYNRKLNKKLGMNLGLRVEQTDAQGDLTVFVDNLDNESNPLNYLQWFPNAGFTYSYNRNNTFNLAYGRRINRPDYNVLNPFNNRLSELSFERGNPNLNPEIVNNVELGWTLKYRFNFKLAYSKTDDQITRLIAPEVPSDENGNPIDPNDDGDIRVGSISWANLATQQIYSFSSSLPFQMTKKWSAFFNASASYQDNQSDDGRGGVIDVQAFSYNIFQQHTFDLGKGFKGEISGWFAGPGIWGGVFLYDESWALNLGLQRKFLNKKLNIKVSANDIFYQSGWNGSSNFAGLFSEGNGRWDSRRVSVNASYSFGNQNVKSRKRKSGLEDEAGRLEN